MIEISLEGLEYLERIDEFFRTVDEYAADALSVGAEAIAAEAKRLAPVGSTGHLADSVRVNEVGGSFMQASLGAEIIADAPHAAAMEFGSGIYGDRGEPYPIVPKHKKALRWPIPGRIGPGGGATAGYAFAKKVMHPGVRPRRYLEQAAETKTETIAEEIAAALELAVRGE